MVSVVPAVPVGAQISDTIIVVVERPKSCSVGAHYRPQSHSLMPTIDAMAQQPAALSFCLPPLLLR